MVKSALVKLKQLKTNTCVYMDIIWAIGSFILRHRSVQFIKKGTTNKQIIFIGLLVVEIKIKQIFHISVKNVYKWLPLILLVGYCIQIFKFTFTKDYSNKKIIRLVQWQKRLWTPMCNVALKLGVATPFRVVRFKKSHQTLKLKKTIN